MRDKIRRRVAQTGDWPPPGAIFGDRYSVSSGIGAMLAANQQFPVPTREGRGNWTDPTLRRSLQPETRTEALPMKKRGGSGKSHGGKKGGIVCAEMDMNAIIAGFREFEKSVCILKHSSGITDTSAKKDDNDTEKKNKMEETEGEEDTAAEKKEEEEEEQETNIDSALPKKKKQVSFVDSVKKPPPSVPLIASHPSPAPSLSSAATPSASVSVEQHSPSTASSLTAEIITVERSDAPREPSPKPKKKQSPKEVEYDELGQTWEVYGAEFDAELLGQAIQKRLERMMGRSFSKDEEDEEGEGSLMKPRTEKCESVKRVWRNLWCFSGRQGKYIEASRSALD